MIGDGVAPLTPDSSEKDCQAKNFACSWCPFRSVCKDTKDCMMDNFGWY